VLGVGAFAISGAQAIHNPGDTSLELDGNVADNPVGDPTDWNNFFPTPPPNTSTFDTTGIIVDPDNATIFTGAQSGGSSKDGQDVSGWRWKCGSVPSKDEIFNAASAKFTVGTEKRLYFMADREATNGDSHIGVWFFRKSINTVPSSGCPSPGTFSDVHTAGSVPHSSSNPGDILVLADFTNGGANVDIKAFEWVGSGGNDKASGGALNFLGSSGNCIGLVHAAGDPELCATSNTIVLGPGNGADGLANTADDGPDWTFHPKQSGAADNSYPINSFFEGGIDLNSLGLQSACFGSVLTETRSSDTTDAILKDFVVSPFEPCTATMSTTPSNTTNPVLPGTAVHDTATVTGSGPTPSGTVSFFLCSFAAGSTDTCDGSDAAHSGTAIAGNPGTLSGSGLVATAQSADVNTAANPLAVGHYCFRATWPGDNNYKPTPPATVFTADGSVECFDVAKIPTAISSVQNWLPNDTATVSENPGSGTPTGTVHFSLWQPAAGATDNCTGTQIYPATSGTTDDETLVSGSASTNNTTVTVTASAHVYWKIHYDGDASHSSSDSCVENTNLTIANS
jgi:hypothetical protein